MTVHQFTPCNWRFVAGHLCGRPAVTVDEDDRLAYHLSLCGRHLHDAIDRAVDEQQRRLAEINDAWQSERAYRRRLNGIKRKFRKTDRGTWEVTINLPTRDGGTRRVRRTGFRYKVDAAGAINRLIDEVEGAGTDIEAAESAIERHAELCAAARKKVETEIARRRAPVDTPGAVDRGIERLRLVYYVRRGDGAIKIGVTSDLDRRLAAFNHVTPVELLATHRGGLYAEQAMHRMFSTHRLSGEWFQPAPALLDHIQRVRDRADA